MGINTTTIDRIAAAEALKALGAAPDVVTAMLAAIPADAPAADVTAPATKAKGKAKAKKAKAATTVEVVTAEEAQALVDAGENPWKVRVLSSNGNAVPFALTAMREKRVARLERPGNGGLTSAERKAIAAANRNALTAAMRAEGKEGYDALWNQLVGEHKAVVLNALNEAPQD